MKKLSVIIVNYNVCYFLEQAIKSVLKAVGDLDLEIIVVDNNSVDGSVELVRKKFPEVVFIANKQNVGFSKANNQAIRIAKGEYVLLLNPDTVVEEDTLVKSCRFMDEHPDAGGLGVKMVDGKGVFLPESKRSLPTPKVAFYKISGLAALFPKSKRFGKYHLGYLHEDETNEIEVLAGAYMMLRKEALDKVGLLDEDYFMYGEDIDLSFRLTEGGYKNYYFPETRIIHYKGESTKKTSVNYVFVFYRAMIIFAEKHFSKNKAQLFSFIINVAIYLRAGVDLSINGIRRAALTLADAGMIFGGMYLLKNFWESSYKLDMSTKFPPEVMMVAVPSYILVWLLSNYLSGGNDTPNRVSKILRGVLIGTILISAISNFTDSYRYSKALILLGGGLTFLILLLNRLIVHYMENRNFQLGSVKEKRVVLIGELPESDRVIKLLENIEANVSVVGFLTPQVVSEKHNAQHLGSLNQLDEIIEIYDVDEVIFCSKDIPANQIIELMVTLNQPYLDYKIVPYDSDYIIGSNSKNRPGDFYTIDLKLNIAERSQLRNKRMLDVFFSVFSLLFFPITMWFVEKKWSYFKNIFNVILGQQTWVGFATRGNINLPKLKNGVLSPKVNYAQRIIDERTALQLDTLYAKDYRVAFDLEIIFRAFSKLGG